MFRAGRCVVVLIINHPGARDAQPVQDALLEWVYAGQACFAMKAMNAGRYRAATGRSGCLCDNSRHHLALPREKSPAQRRDPCRGQGYAHALRTSQGLARDRRQADAGSRAGERLALRSDRTIVVYGHGGEAVPSAFAGRRRHFIRQEPQLGTGHAVQQALPRTATRRKHPGVIWRRAAYPRPTLKGLMSKPGLRLLTAHAERSAGYGRIVRDHAGRIVRIVEEKDASARRKGSARSIPVSSARRRTCCATGCRS